MSQYDDLSQMAGKIFGSDNAPSAQQIQGAVEHMRQMDPNELVDQLKASVGSMNPSSLSSLGQQLLQTFTNHQSYNGDGAQAAQEAGTSEQEVASGRPGAVSAIIDYARSNPQILQAATTAFTERNPQALKDLAPGLLSGIMQRLGFSQPQPQ
jgi:hypothetical protein